MRALLDLLARLPGFEETLVATRAGESRDLTGLSGSSRALLTAWLFERLHRTVLVICASTKAAEAWYDDLHTALRPAEEEQATALRLFPSLPTLLYSDLAVDRQLVGLRLDAMEALLRGDPVVVVAPLSAVLHRTIPASAMAGSDLQLEVGLQIAPEALLERLAELGYGQHDPVLMPGQCARRGGIVDVYPLTAPQPLRVEFWGDEIESLRYFDVNTQRSTTPQERFTVTVSRESVRTQALSAATIAAISRSLESQVARLHAAGRSLEANRLKEKVTGDVRKLQDEEPFDGSDHYLPFLYDEVATVLDYLPPRSLVVVDDPAAVAARAAELASEVEEVYRTKLNTGSVVALPAPLYVAYDPQRPLWHDHPSVQFHHDGAPPTAQAFEVLATPSCEGHLDQAIRQVQGWQDEGYRLLVTTHQGGRMRQILTSHGVGDVLVCEPDELPRPGNAAILDRRLSAGFTVPALQLAVLTDHEVFGWRRVRTRAGRTVAHRGSTALASLTELAVGEKVVHIHFGVGVYQGLITRQVRGVSRDYLQLDYAGADRLFVPVTELDRIHKYLGPDGFEPELNGLGDNRWRRTSAKARKKAEAVARDLLELYARRSQAEGHGFSPDNAAMMDMEAAFIYEETGDQLKALEAIKRDMEAVRTMDRLICGDVGFGKTEVAVRAAFKAVQDRRQVAVLVPTTVLAQQHHATFCERLEQYGCVIEVLSRFRSRKEQAEVVQRARAGEVDILIGTHRLLSADIELPRLGLLVIDEEQRFGVRHKDAIKRLRLNVDVLTMTATPIPRTLNAAMIGVRDLSLLQEPPQGRLPVITQVVERVDERIKDAILRELDRDGQVYFLHNRVRSIEGVARKIENLVPHARVAVAHGQMHEDELEEVMVEMYSGLYDVLVCTSIIESGLDIPNANTILVDDCDQFGLAQLYQLIGRVGRRERQAYAWLMHQRHRELTPEATRRLEAITEFSELGSGFSIALRDLEIRGSGNLLGVEQAGFAEEVGYEFYTQMLQEALRTLSGDPGDEPIQLVSDVELPLQANLPPLYVRDEQQRIDLYRRLSLCRSEEQVLDLENEIRDRFGRPPSAVTNLTRVLRLRMRCDGAGVKLVRLAGARHLVVEFDEHHHLEPAELRVFARGVQREAAKGSPKLQLTREGLTGDLKEPRTWDMLDAAEVMVRMTLAARADLGAAAGGKVAAALAAAKPARGERPTKRK
ncbi:MAG: transcription-repair coupling factor [Fimbriimonadaceae bacterium]|nr:transcription-repair coupling factor [Fimbriimonadaceae bacterium]